LPDLTVLRRYRGGWITRRTLLLRALLKHEKLASESKQHASVRRILIKTQPASAIERGDRFSCVDHRPIWGWIHCFRFRNL